MLAEDDDLDMESLQAQIDMSMSFANNLVTSWIKPTHLTQLRSSGVNAPQMLEEELRRPPRLGVGAPIPTAPPLAYEASRLKRRLGKVEAKHGGVVEPQPEDSLKSDDEQPKGRAIKRKMRTDPFRLESNKKKRRAESTANSDPSAENVSKHPVSLLQSPTPGRITKHDPFHRQEKQRMGPGHQQSHMTEGQRLVSSPPVTLPVQTTFCPSLTAPTGPSRSELSRKTSAPVPGKPTTPESSRVHTNYKPIPDKAKPHGIPLLNLDGPPELTDKPGDTSEMNYSKKKRKRRKKDYMITGTGAS